MLSRNRVEILEVYYASERHRAVCVPVNPSSGKASRLLLVRRLRLRGVAEFSDYRKFTVDTSATFTPPPR